MRFCTIPSYTGSAAHVTVAAQIGSPRRSLSPRGSPPSGWLGKSPTPGMGMLPGLPGVPGPGLPGPRLPGPGCPGCPGRRARRCRTRAGPSSPLQVGRGPVGVAHRGQHQVGDRLRGLVRVGGRRSQLGLMVRSTRSPWPLTLACDQPAARAALDYRVGQFLLRVHELVLHLLRRSEQLLHIDLAARIHCALTLICTVASHRRAATETLCCARCAAGRPLCQRLVWVARRACRFEPTACRPAQAHRLSGPSPLSLGERSAFSCSTPLPGARPGPVRLPPPRQPGPGPLSQT